MIRAICVTCILQLTCVIPLPVIGQTVAASAPITEGAENAEWGKSVGGQAISISTERATYAPVETILLTVRFKNVGQGDVRVIQTSPFTMYRIEVLLPNRKEAPFTLCGKEAHANRGIGSNAMIVLKPAEQRVARFNLSRLFDFSLTGKYTVFVQRDVLTGANDMSTSEATSNRLEITVDDALGKPAQENLGER